MSASPQMTRYLITFESQGAEQVAILMDMLGEKAGKTAQKLEMVGGQLSGKTVSATREMGDEVEKATKSWDAMGRATGETSTTITKVGKDFEATEKTVNKYTDGISRSTKVTNMFQGTVLGSTTRTVQQVGTTINDLTTKYDALGNATQTISSVTTNADTAFARTETTINNLSDAVEKSTGQWMRHLKWTVQGIAIWAGINAVKDLVWEWADVQKTLNDEIARFSIGSKDASVSAEQYLDVVMRIAREAKLSPLDVAPAATVAYRTGQEDLLPYAAQITRIAGVDTTTVLREIIALHKQFPDRSMISLLDAYTSAWQSSTMSAEQFFGLLETSGGMARQFNTDFETVVSILSQAGTIAGESGDKVERFVRQLSLLYSDTDMASRVEELTGVSPVSYTQTGEEIRRPIQEVLGDISRLPEAARMQIAQLFPKGLGQPWQEWFFGLTTGFEGITSEAGAFADAAEKMGDTWGAALEGMTGSWQGFLSILGEIDELVALPKFVTVLLDAVGRGVQETQEDTDPLGPSGVWNVASEIVAAVFKYHMQEQFPDPRDEQQKIIDEYTSRYTPSGVPPAGATYRTTTSPVNFRMEEGDEQAPGGFYASQTAFQAALYASRDSINAQRVAAGLHEVATDRLTAVYNAAGTLMYTVAIPSIVDFGRAASEFVRSIPQYPLSPQGQLESLVASTQANAPRVSGSYTIQDDSKFSFDEIQAEMKRLDSLQLRKAHAEGKDIDYITTFSMALNDAGTPIGIFEVEITSAGEAAAALAKQFGLFENVFANIPTEDWDATVGMYEKLSMRYDRYGVDKGTQTNLIGTGEDQYLEGAYSAPWAEAASSVRILTQWQDKLADAYERGVNKWKSWLTDLPGVGSATPVTQYDLSISKLGLYENKFDEPMRRVRQDVDDLNKHRPLEYGEINQPWFAKYFDPVRDIQGKEGQQARAGALEMAEKDFYGLTMPSEAYAGSKDAFISAAQDWVAGRDRKEANVAMLEGWATEAGLGPEAMGFIESVDMPPMVKALLGDSTYEEVMDEVLGIGEGAAKALDTGMTGELKKGTWLTTVTGNWSALVKADNGDEGGGLLKSLGSIMGDSIQTGMVEGIGDRIMPRIVAYIIAMLGENE